MQRTLKVVVGLLLLPTEAYIFYPGVYYPDGYAFSFRVGPCMGSSNVNARLAADCYQDKYRVKRTLNKTQLHKNALQI